ncbi:MAG TPA: cation diffusion facilitator family transporter [Bacteroidales bacterium]|nr:cation diffusion facilitator family transporter [Bacteroidales bacterium]HQI71331.1 cation diffusion facilitator family transporter [Bacteroidales bacterium]
MINKATNRKSLASIVWFSIIASILTILLKSTAYYITGSVGFFSDAMESFINLAAAIIAFIMLTIAARPPDKEHPFGHDKAEYFSSLIEGILIVLAAIGIIYTAVNRIFHPQPLEELNIGMGLSAFATLINFVTARILLHYGRKHNSITLEADSHHLMADVWTTIGIIIGILLVKLTNWQLLDPLMGIAVAIYIIFTGMKLIVRSTDGLMDSKISEKEIMLVKQILNRYATQGINYHSLYTRRAASKSFITFHLLFPGDLTIHEAHEFSKTIEKEIITASPLAHVFVHLEPLSDPEAFDDIQQKNG